MNREAAVRPLRRSRTREVMANTAFRRLWAIGGASTAMRWLDTVAVGAFVFELTGSPFDVALTFVFRMLPMFVLGAYIGAISDRLNRRLILMIAFGALATVYSLLAVAVMADVIQLWHVYIGTLLAGGLWATDFPVRRAMVSEVVPRENLPTAMGLDLATGNFMRIPGPFLGGFLLDAIGMDAVYVLGATLFLLGAVAAFSLSYAPAAKPAVRISPLRNIGEGIRYIRRDSVIMTVLIVTVVMNMFAFPYQSMIPVISERVFGVSSTLMGLLISAEGLGATLGSLWIASRATPARYSRIYFWGAVLFLLMVLSFSRLPWYGMAIPVLFVAGFGMSGFGTMQSIMIISTTPPEMRGRVLGVLAVTIGTGPVAALTMGAIAEVAGAPLTVMAFALGGLTILALIAVRSPGFLRLRDVRPMTERDEMTVSVLGSQRNRHDDENGHQDDGPDHEPRVDSRAPAAVPHSGTPGLQPADALVDTDLDGGPGGSGSGGQTPPGPHQR